MTNHKYQINFKSQLPCIKLNKLGSLMLWDLVII
jgi:hypothetical protein